MMIIKQETDFSDTALIRVVRGQFAERIRTYLNVTQDTRLLFARLECLVGYLAGVSATLILADVISREAFGTPIYGTNEIVADDHCFLGTW